MRILIGLVLRAVALAMGIATAAMVLLGEGTYKRAFLMLAIGLICLALASLEQFSRGLKIVEREPPREDPPSATS